MTTPHTKIALISHKPGVGKSTASVLSCFELAEQGYRVGAVDGDRKSQTMRKWLDTAIKRANKVVDGVPQGTPVPFEYLSAAHDDIVDYADEKLPAHDIRVYDIQGGDDELTRAVMADATDVIICSTMSDFDRSMIATAMNSAKAGLVEHDRPLFKRGVKYDDSNPPVRLWVLFGRATPGRVFTRKNGQRVNTAEFEGYCNTLIKQDLFVFDSFLPDLKAFEKVFKRHPADTGVPMTYIRNLINEMKEEKIIRG